MHATEDHKGQERRRYQRYAIRCDCWLEGKDVTIYGTTADLGMGGLFLRSAIPVGDGHEIQVQLNVAGGHDPILASATITRAVPARSGRRHGIGVEFTQIQAGRAVLDEFLRDRIGQDPD